MRESGQAHIALRCLNDPGTTQVRAMLRHFIDRICKTKQGGSKRSALIEVYSSFLRRPPLVADDAAIPIHAIVRIPVVGVVVVAILVVSVVQSLICGIN